MTGFREPSAGSAFFGEEEECDESPFCVDCCRDLPEDQLNERDLCEDCECDRLAEQQAEEQNA